MGDERADVEGVDIEREVHFALKPAPVGDAFHEGNHLQDAATATRAPVRAYLLLAPVVLVLGPLVGVAAEPVVVIVLLVGAAWAHHFVRAKVRAREGGGVGVSEHSDPRHRLRVVGPGADRMVGMTLPDESEAFEPVVFRIRRAHEPAGRTVAKALFMTGVVGVLLIAGWWYVRATAPRSVAGILLTFMIFGGAMGSMMWGLVWPTYVRLVPGRLDILQYRFMGWGRPRIRTYDLRTARLLLMPGRGCLIVKRRERSGEWILSPWLGQGRSMEFEYWVLTAALSSAEAPALPDDELVG